MDARSFMFDLVILNVWLPEFDYQNNSISVNVTFNDKEFTIESCQARPAEFKQGRTCEFRSYPDELRNDLQDHPLKLQIKSNEVDVIGEASLAWSPEMLDKLEGENFVTFSHFDECDIVSNSMNVGKIGVQYRLRAKCQLSESEDEEGVGKCCDIQGELKRIVSRNDVFFLIQNDSDTCNVGRDDRKKEPHCGTALDLARFKRFQGKVVTDQETFDQVYSLDCCHKKKYVTNGIRSNACGNDVPSMVNPNLRNLTEKCAASQSSVEWACKASQHIQECPHSNKFSDETTGSCSCDGTNDCSEPQGVFQNGRMKNICGYPQSPPVLKETLYIRPKLCSICQNDVSWLPKLAACPKCGHKPTPYAVERPYNENLTADQVLEEWADENQSQARKPGEGRTKCSNRCTCSGGKVCAYCRIRKLCSDVLQTKKCRDPNKDSTASAASVKEAAPDNICKSTASENDSRPHLARVFSELRDLYNLKPEKIQQRFELNKACEKSFADRKRQKNKAKRAASPARGNMEEKPDLTKKMPPEVKAKWCKGKIYDYKAVRKYPGTQIGHKSCVCSGKSVPRNMGWLWNIETNGMRRGWRPGAIRKPIKEIMKYFLKDFPIDSIRVSKYAHKAVAKKVSDELVQKPTLHICKKGGVYTITMRPLKEASLLKQCADPYAEMKPIRFKIVKNPLSVYASEVKRQLKNHFTKCTCHKPVVSCYCRSYLDKKRLEFELNKACRARGLPSLKDSLVLSDTSDSEVEFDFGVTPPAGLIKLQNRNRPDLVSHETQYNEKDWIIKSKLSKPLSNKYMKPLDASDGRRKATSAMDHVKTGRTTTTTDRAAASRRAVTEAYNLARERGAANSFKVGGSVGQKYGSGKGADRNLDGRPPFNQFGYVLRTHPLMFNHLARRAKPDPCAVVPCPCVPTC